jgi:hypothetical protein
LIENVNLLATDAATCYAALATNADNGVGVTYFMGGGSRFPTAMVNFSSVDT